MNGLYEVSNLGRVRSLNYNHTNKNKELKQNTVHGYKYVHLCTNNVIKSSRVHRLVAEAFIDNPNNLPQVNHKDGNKQNNNIENLEWVTASENRKHAFKIGLQKVSCTGKGKFGKLHSNSKTILCEETNIIYYGACEAERATGIEKTNIRSCCKGKLKTAGGFHWRYVNEG